MAFAEDRAIFDGYPAGGIGAIAKAISQRLAGVNGPYSVLLGADAYTALAETVDHGFPVLEHVRRSSTVS